MSVTTDKPRVNFASVKNPLPYPDFLEVQLRSFKDFLQLDTPPEKRTKEGLYKVFSENFPIADTRNNFVLEFLDYYIDPPRYTIEECLERGLTYCVPLKAKLKLYCTDPDHEDFDTVVQDVYLGQIPYMTEKGTFVINGAERVVVSQLHRSPGVFFGQSIHANGTKLYSARIIPFRGSWIEFATDINNVMYAYIDRKKKLPVTTLLRAIGLETDKDIIDIFDLAEEVRVNKTNLKKALGRKLAARVLRTWVEDFVDEDTGEMVSIERNEVVIDREKELDEDGIDLILESGVDTILLHKETLLYRSRPRGFRDGNPGCLSRPDSLHDREGHICDQWRGTRRCVAAPPFARRVLRTEHPLKRHEALFGPYHPLPRFMDRVCH